VTDEDHALLRLAGAQMPLPGQRERAIAQLGLTPVRFWQRVNAMLDDGDALAAEPSVVWRLRRLRAFR
jgi:hypothetical protein